MWIDPIGGTGILLGRRDGAAEPLATVWPALGRGAQARTQARSLSDDQIRSSVLLDQAALERYARVGTLITDDNQLLQFSTMRAGLHGQRGAHLGRMNLIILSKTAGHAPFRVD